MVSVNTVVDWAIITKKSSVDPIDSLINVFSVINCMSEVIGLHDFLTAFLLVDWQEFVKDAEAEGSVRKFLFEKCTINSWSVFL